MDLSRQKALLREELILRSPLWLRKLRYRTPPHWKHMDYAQKLKWRCLNPDPYVDYVALVDKFRVKEQVRSHFPSPETYALVHDVEDIDVEALPPTYVMKTTHGWNQSTLVSDGVIIGQNQTKLLAGQAATAENLKAIATEWAGQPVPRPSLEIHYRFLTPAIMFEEYLDPVDFEIHFHLFDGRCRATEVLCRNDFNVATGGYFKLYDADWQRLEPFALDAGNFEELESDVPRPDDRIFLKLEELFSAVDQVRADFFVRGGEFTLNEFTFTHNRGIRSRVSNYDEELGTFWRERP